MRLLGLDATPTELRIARAERRFGATRLLDCTRVRCATAEARRAALDGALAWSPSTIVAALPLAHTAHRLLPLPFRDVRRVRETVALELMGQLPGDPGDLVSGHLVVERGSDGSRALAVVARGASVRGLCATLADAGAAPHRIDPALVGAWSLVDPAQARDGALVLADGERSAVAVHRDGRLAGLRALAAPAADRPGFVRELGWVLAALAAPAPVVLAGPDADAELAGDIERAIGRPVVALADVAAGAWRRDALGACAVAAGLLAGPGLALYEASEAHALRGTRVAALAAAAVLVALADVGLVRWHLARQDAALRAAIEATAAAALPPGSRVVAPRTQLEAIAGGREARAATPGQVLALLRELSDRVPDHVRLELDELALDGDVLRLRGRTDRFETIDAVTRALATAAGLRDVRAEDSRAALDGRGVEFGVRATWRPVVGAPS
jgi:hypothetical protein